MEVLKDKRDMFGVDFDENKKALNQISTIRSKILKNELAGYITKFIKNELRNKEIQTKDIESKEEMQKEIDILLDRLLPSKDAQTDYQKRLWREKLKGFVESQIAHFKTGWKVVEREREFQGDIGGLTFKGRIDLSKPKIDILYLTDTISMLELRVKELESVDKPILSHRETQAYVRS